MSKQTLQIENGIINGLSNQVAIADLAFDNIYQGEIEMGEKGSTRKYTNDTSAATIRIVQNLPLPTLARELGASINGGNFSQYSYQPTSREFVINLITVVDDLVDIPQVRVDMIPVDILRANVKNITDKVVLNANAIKMAARLFECYTAKHTDADSMYDVEFTSASDKFTDKLNKAIIKLDKGDKDHGISLFPREKSITIVRAEAQEYLFSVAGGGVLALGGANYGYDVLKNGGVDAQAQPQRLESGYIGRIFGVDCHFATDLVWELAEQYCGFPSGTFGKIEGVVANSVGNFFGMAGNSTMALGDCPIGVGTRIKPLYRMGAACGLPKSNCFIYDNGFVNPYGLKSVFTTGVVWSYLAPGSREFHDLTITSSATKKLTATDSKAVAIKYVIGTTTKPAETIEAFLGLYNAQSAVKGDLTSGTEATINEFASGVYALVCSVAADGTVTVKCSEAAA